jgi:hypothetical protein
VVIENSCMWRRRWMIDDVAHFRWRHR